MAFDVVKRVAWRIKAYLYPLVFLAIAVYGIYSGPRSPLNAHVHIRHISRSAGNRNLLVPAQRCPQSEQTERACL